jgi:hypothetical protein
MRSADGENKKPPARITVAVESKILASREEAAQMFPSARGRWTTLSRRGAYQHGALADGFSSRFPSLENMRVPIILSGSWRRRRRQVSGSSRVCGASRRVAQSWLDSRRPAEDIRAKRRGSVIQQEAFGRHWRYRSSTPEMSSRLQV